MAVRHGDLRRRVTLEVADVEAAAGLLRAPGLWGLRDHWGAAPPSAPTDSNQHSWGTWDRASLQGSQRARVRVLLRCQSSDHRRAAVEARAAGLSGLLNHRGAGPCQQSLVMEPDVPLETVCRVHLREWDSGQRDTLCPCRELSRPAPLDHPSCNQLARAQIALLLRRFA